MSAMPGFRVEHLLGMFGDSPKLAPLVSYGPGSKRYFLVRLPATLARAVGWLLFAERYIERAQEAADRFDGRIHSALAENPTGAALHELLRSSQTWASAALETMSVATSMANRLLGTLLSIGGQKDGTTPADAAALAVTGDIESLEPVRRLAAFGEWLRENPDRDAGDREVEARLTAFMKVCGFRCEEEAELANPRWIEQPEAVLRLARQLASAPGGLAANVAVRSRTEPAPLLPGCVSVSWRRRRARGSAGESEHAPSCRGSE
jgi:hypothetical protein